MIMRAPDIQFRDNIFLNRSSLSKHSRVSHPYLAQVKISRSTWTKKVRKYQQSQLRGGNGDHSFQNRFVQPSPIKNRENGLVRQAKAPIVSDMNRMKRQSHLHQNFITKQRSPKSSIPLHFQPNRNVYNQNLHEDLSQSGILIEKLDNQHQTTLIPNNKSKDSRQFLKSLKLKNNFNLFKGNFSKFTKKDIIHCIKNKRFNLTSDFQASGWQHERTRLFV